MRATVARERRWPRRLATGIVAAFASVVLIAWLSPTAAGWVMVRLGLTSWDPAFWPATQAGGAETESQPRGYGRGEFNPSEPPEWVPGENLRSLRAQYAAEQDQAPDTPVTITILYDLPPASGPAARCDDGFAALIEGLEKVILFDAGLNPDVLDYNVRAMGRSLEDVEAVVLSHTSGDHFRGIEAFAEVSRRPIVYHPAEIETDRLGIVTRYASETRAVSGAMRLMRGVYTTGVSPGHGEFALIIATPQGPVQVLSCGHIGRVPFLDQALRLAGRPLYLDVGGFCPLWQAPYEYQIKAWAQVRERDPQYIAYCHCAPDGLRLLAAGEWPDRSIRVGGGSVITIPTGPPAPPQVQN